MRWWSFCLKQFSLSPFFPPFRFCDEKQIFFPSHPPTPIFIFLLLRTHGESSAVPFALDGSFFPPPSFHFAIPISLPFFSITLHFSMSTKIIFLDNGQWHYRGRQAGKGGQRGRVEKKNLLTENFMCVLVFFSHFLLQDAEHKKKFQ